MIGFCRVSFGNGRKKGFISLYILYSLKQKPKSGYEILAEIKGKCGGKWVPSKGTIYPLLNQLEKQGLIRVKTIEKRSKNIFEITSKGKQTLSMLKRSRKELKENFMRFRKLFFDILGEDKSDIFDLLFEIKENLLRVKNKPAATKILERCLDELKQIK